MRKIVLTYGFIAGAILVVLMVIHIALREQIGFDRGMIVGYTTMVLAFLMVFVGVKTYRDRVCGGSISFGRAFQVGILISAIAASCYVAAWQVVYRTMWPNFGEEYSAYVMQQARARGESEDALAKRQAELDQFQRLYRNPLVNIAYTFLEPLPVALVFTLVTAAVLRRRRVAATLPDGTG